MFRTSITSKQASWKVGRRAPRHICSRFVEWYMSNTSWLNDESSSVDERDIMVTIDLMRSSISRQNSLYSHATMTTQNNGMMSSMFCTASHSYSHFPIAQSIARKMFWVVSKPHMMVCRLLLANHPRTHSLHPISEHRHTQGMIPVIPSLAYSPIKLNVYIRHLQHWQSSPIIKTNTQS